MRSIQKTLNLTKTEKEIFQQAAKRMGLPVGTFIRFVALEQSKQILSKNEQEVFS